MDSDTILKYIFTDGSNLSKTQRILFVLLSYLFFFSISIWDYLSSGDLFALELLLVVCAVTLPLCYPFLFYEKFVGKHGMSKLRGGISYQGWSRSLSLLAPGGFVICIFLGYNLHNLMLETFALAFIIPFFALFFRLNLFNDSNCCLEDEIVFGYPPNFYGFICLFLGLFGIYNIFDYYYIDFNYFIVCLFVVLIFQIIVVIPDIFNGVLPFEIRTKRGFVIFIGGVLGIYLLSLVLLCGNLIFANINFDWSLSNIMRKIITYGIIIILVMLFYKQAKKMNEKKK